MRIIHIQRITMCCTAAFLVVIPVQAQTVSGVDIVAGYAPLLDASASLNTTVDRPRLEGWNIEAAIHGGGKFSGIIAIDGASGRMDGPSAWGTRNEWRDFGALAGVRYSFTPRRRIVPSVQLLVGTFNTTLKYVAFGVEQIPVKTDSMILQPGAGINLMLTDRIGVRLAADLKAIPNFDWVDSDSGRSMARVSVGAVVALFGR